MNFISVKNNKKTINLKNKTKNYEVNAQWLYEHSTNSEIRDNYTCLLYTSPSPRHLSTSRMPSCS